MKIQLDYDNKIVKLENNVLLSVFIEKIQKILPDWKKWKLETSTTINNWNNPYPVIYRDITPYKPWWQQPYCEPHITFCSGEKQYSSNDLIPSELKEGGEYLDNYITGTYNLEISDSSFSNTGITSLDIPGCQGNA